MATGVTVLSESPLRLKVAPNRRGALLGLLGSLVLLVGAPLPLVEELPALAGLAFLFFLPVVYLAIGRLVNHLVLELGEELRVTESPLPFRSRGPFARRDVSEIAVRSHRRRRRTWHSIDACVSGRWKSLGTAVDLATMNETAARLSAALMPAAPAASAAPAAPPAQPVLTAGAPPAARLAPAQGAPALVATFASLPRHAQVLRRLVELGAPPVDALLDAAAPLGVLVAPQVGWSDAHDLVWLGAGWPPADAALRARVDAVRMQKVSVPALAARLGPPTRFRLGTSRTDPRGVTTTVQWSTTLLPAQALQVLVATGKVKDTAATEMARLWPPGLAALELKDVAGLPHTWSFLGVLERQALVPVVESLAAAMRLLDAHRAVPHRLAQLPGTFALSLSAAFDTVLPEVHLHVTGIDWATARELVQAAIGDAPRASRVVTALSEAGGHPTVSLRLATEGPIRVSLTVPVL